MALKKFNKKALLNHISRTVRDMEEEEAFRVVDGTFLLFNIVQDYYLNTYGSCKRMDDLFEYIVTLQSAYLKKDFKK